MQDQGVPGSQASQAALGGLPRGMPQAIQVTRSSPPATRRRRGGAPPGVCRAPKQARTDGCPVVVNDDQVDQVGLENQVLAGQAGQAGLY